MWRIWAILKIILFALKHWQTSDMLIWVTNSSSSSCDNCAQCKGPKWECMVKKITIIVLIIAVGVGLQSQFQTLKLWNISRKSQEERGEGGDSTKLREIEIVNMHSQDMNWEREDHVKSPTSHKLIKKKKSFEPTLKHGEGCFRWQRCFHSSRAWHIKSSASHSILPDSRKQR